METPWSRSRIKRSQDGAIAIVVAIATTLLVIVAALVVDFGAARVDRQTNKLASDAAVMAGLRAADQDTGNVYTSLGACGALAFLRANRPALSGLPDGVCATPDPSKICAPGNASTFTHYYGTTTSGRSTYEVWIRSPYTVTETVGGGAFPEESLGSFSGDVGETSEGGCDQIGVIVRESSTPGLGRIVTNGPIVSRIRSVGRVKFDPGDVPPALLLLEQTSCSVLTVGSGGSPSRISIAGFGVVPATIHSDSSATGADCGSGSNQQLFQGKQTDGVVAHGGSGGVSGSITSFATYNGIPASVVTDNPANVYGTTGIYPAVAGTKSAVSGRRLVTRRPLDTRYLGGVTTMVRGAYPHWNLNHSSPTGYTTRVGCPSGGPAAMAAYMSVLSSLTATDSVYIDCPANSGITLSGSIGAGTIYFHGFISGGNLSMPNATKVYIDNTDNAGDRIGPSTPAITLSNGDTFCLRTAVAQCVAATPSVGQCSDTPTGSPTAKATLMIRRGQLESNGGALLRLCNTTAVLEGGQLGAGTATNPGGCLPTAKGTPPTATPCVGASTPAGTSPISLSGYTDWTAPNAFGDMAAAGYTTDALKQPFWDGGEDLALWTETYGTGPTFKMAGGGNMHIAGVFMVPNAFPFTITGSGIQDLTNAQYVTRAFAVDGGATLKMQVDPHNAVGIPTLDPFTLVR